MMGHSILGRNTSEKDLAVTADNQPDKPEHQHQEGPDSWRNESSPWLHGWHS